MRTAILHVFLSLCSFIVNAQSLFIGAQMGGNLASANVSSSIKVDVTGNNGVIAGALAEMKLGKGFALRIEPGYVEKGADMVTPTISTTYDHLIRLHSVDVPVLLQYNVLDGALTPVVFAGPNFSFINKASDSYAILKVWNQPIVGGSRTEEDLKDYCQSFDLLMEIGAGMEYALHDNVRFFANARYSYGLTNLVKKDFLGITGTWNTADVRILAGVKFGLL
jgi:hypothetical protein